MSTIFQVEQIKNRIDSIKSPNKKLTNGLYTRMDSGYIVVGKDFFDKRVRDQTDTVNAVSKLLSSKNVNNSAATGLSYSKVAGDLLNTFLSDGLVIKDHDFRDLIFIDFMKNMSGMTFSDFLNIQTENMTIMPIHTRYLMETYNYLVFGRVREVNNFTWLSLITDTDSGTSTTTFKLKQFINELDKNTLTALGGGHKLVSNWLKRENGIVDLLYFNKLVFGISDARGAL